MRTRRILGLLVLGALALGAATVLAMTLRPHDLAGTAQAQGEPSLALDMDADNGSGPCNPIDATRSFNLGDTFHVAVCLTDSPLPPAAFQFDLLYNLTINQCVPSDCTGTTCVDSNPDANAGKTTWGGTSLGDGWDCSMLNVNPPVCNKNTDLPTDVPEAANGDAGLECLSVEPPALKVGAGVSAAIAVVTFKSIAMGTDTFDLSMVEVDQVNGMKLVGCENGGAAPVGSCAGGSVAITAAGAPTATVAATAAPAEATAAAATAAAIGPIATAAAATAAAAAATAVAQGTPIAAINQAATAAAAAAGATSAAVATKTAAGATSTPGGKATAKPTAAAGEGGGSSGPNAGVIAAIVVGAVVVVGGVGWFAWRRLRAG